MNNFKNGVKLIPLHVTDDRTLNDIIQLSSKVFGEGFLSKQKLIQEIIMSSIGNIINAVTLYKNETLIGYGICYAGGTWGKKDVEFDKDIDEIEKTGYIKTVMLDGEYQGEGYGKIILDSLISTAQILGNKKVLLHAWDGSPNNSSINFFLKNGAKVIKKYENKWYKDSIKNGWYCAKCGNPCYCSSIEMIINDNN